MPRDNDKDNASRGRRDRPTGGKGRPAARDGQKRFSKKFEKGGFAGKGDKRPFRGDREDRPFRRRDEDAPRRDRDDQRPRRFDRDDRPPRRDRDEARPAGRFQDRKFKGRRDERDFGGRDRGHDKPWGKRDDRPRDDRGGDERPRFARARDERRDDRPKFDRPRWDRKGAPGDRKGAPGDRKGGPGDRKGGPGDRKGGPGDRNEREDRRDRQGDRPKYDRPRQRPEGRMDWQEHPRSDRRFAERPRRDNEDDSRIFAKRPAFGGRGAYRERKVDFDKRAPREETKSKKSGERIAKVLARAGLASRRDAEEMVVQGRVAVNGRIINSPALDVTANDVVSVDGKPLPPRERTRLFLYHKPRGLMTTHADPEGRPTVFQNLPEGLPRLISVGRLDFNTEGLLLLTNDGGLARELELPETGWLRRYRVRAHGEVTQAQLDQLKDGVEVDGVKYGQIDATLERDQGSNVWLVFAIREGKNREVRNVLAHLGLDVNRLIRISYGPFQLGELGEGTVEEVKTRVLREQLGEKVIARSGADFARPDQHADDDGADVPRAKKPFKPSGKSALVADRKGRRVLVQRTGSEEARARNEMEAAGYGPPRRPKRGYHGKRDFRPRDDE
jgi:23S rRNA pseudouridine2605 synthase